MTDRDRLKSLETLAGLLRDRDMAKLHRLSAKAAETRTKITQLAQPVAICSDPTLFSAQQAHISWATSQKMQLNVTLARQTADTMNQKVITARSMGRAQAVSDLAQRQARPWRIKE